jgi:hypothetical protein
MPGAILPGSDLTGRRSARCLPKLRFATLIPAQTHLSTGERRAAIFAAAPTTLDENQFPVSNALPLAPDFTERVLSSMRLVSCDAVRTESRHFPSASRSDAKAAHRVTVQRVMTTNCLNVMGTWMYRVRYKQGQSCPQNIEKCNQTLRESL